MKAKHEGRERCERSRPFSKANLHCGDLITSPSTSQLATTAIGESLEVLIEIHERGEGQAQLVCPVYRRVWNLNCSALISAMNCCASNGVRTKLLGGVLVTSILPTEQAEAMALQLADIANQELAALPQYCQACSLAYCWFDEFGEAIPQEEQEKQPARKGGGDD